MIQEFLFIYRTSDMILEGVLFDIGAPIYYIGPPIWYRRCPIWYWSSYLYIGPPIWYRRVSYL